jgi:hypothetical protein
MMACIRRSQLSDFFTVLRPVDDQGRNVTDKIRSRPIKVPESAEKKGTGQLFCELIDGTCSGVLAYLATNTVDLSLTDRMIRD